MNVINNNLRCEIASSLFMSNYRYSGEIDDICWELLINYTECDPFWPLIYIQSTVVKSQGVVVQYVEKVIYLPLVSCYDMHSWGCQELFFEFPVP